MGTDTNQKKILFLHLPKIFSYILVVLVVLVVLFILLFCFVGHHQHIFEVQSNDMTFRLVSRKSPFEVALPDIQTKGEFIIGKSFVKLTGNTVQPFKVNGWGVIHSSQVVLLPPDVTTCACVVNGIDIILTGKELRIGDQRKTLRPGVPLEINLDHFEYFRTRRLWQLN